MFSDSLAELSKKFDDWRSGGRLGHKVPAELKSMTLELLSEHKAVELQQALGISSNTICNWRKQLNNQATIFISLPPAAIVKNPEKLLLKVSSGHLSVEGELTLSQWEQALGLLQK